ncbi:MAG: 3-isopropylmalate dehydratase large subunit [Acidaminococcales bacterium]|jgi:3-isopropylmalate/(R)-2-methylmalate dehydratase large subunit|nr:3-isopropylmalate dehydratase large subunit [Acidaminococcales bacterium]
MTVTQKILARRAEVDKVEAGDIITAAVDLALTNDIMGAQTFAEFEKIGRPAVFDKNKVVLVPDHFCPANDMKSAELAKKLREFARKYQIAHYFEIGRMGIEHALLPDSGLIAPGDLIVGADSHTCTYGALNAFATGVGLTDLGAALATGRAWLKVPAAIGVELCGSLPRYVRGKDVVLALIGRIGVDGARYKSLEYSGSGVARLTMADRFTIANMAIEAGAKNGIFPCDSVTEAYLEGRAQRACRPETADADAFYEKRVAINLSLLEPVVACPHLPENVKPAKELSGVAIDQAVIGSCTNGRLDDLAQAAEILKGRKINKKVRAIVIPATQEIYSQAMALGYLRTFVDAGAAVSTPTCGPCFGGHMGILAAGERAVSTTNRNFKGRMGAADSEIYLAGPYVAAASAVTGRITDPAEIAGA